MKSKKIPTYLKYYLSKTRLDGLVFNKTYLENLSGTSFYLDHSIEDKIKINFKASESTQDSTPTPESPQEIHVIKGDNEVVIENKNLFDKDNANTLNAYINGTNKKIEALNTTKTLYISCEPNTTYTIQRLAGRRFIAISSPNYEIGTTGTNIVQNNTGSVITITTGNNDNYLCVFYYHSSHDTLTEQQILDSIQIEEGSQATTYVEHKEQNYPLSLGNLEMCNINNYADAFFKNVPECEYYDNTLEVGKWYKYGRIGKVVLNGSEPNWGDRPNYTYADRFVADNIIYAPQSVWQGFSNYFIVKKNDISFDYPYLFINYRQIGVNFSEKNTTTLAQFKEWLSTYKITVYYILLTPTKTLLPDTLQEQLDNIYNNAHTYDKITNINQVNEDRPFILDISYYRKVK